MVEGLNLYGKFVSFRLQWGVDITHSKLRGIVRLNAWFVRFSMAYDFSMTRGEW